MKQRTDPDDNQFMLECLALASRGAGRVSPNPMVGAILVKKGKVLSRGWHREFGRAHAEVDCLNHAKGSVAGATMYVNLEPCAHVGKTPACAPRVAASGVSRVVIGMIDPNPLVAGRGIRYLRAHGIEVTVGVCNEESRFLNRAFVTHITKHRPYIHLKLAQSLDGRISDSRRRWISGETSRRLVHQWRTVHDAVLVGAGTVLSDNPSLNVRFVSGRDPHVVILDGRLRISPDARLVASAKKRRVVVCTSTGALKKKGRRANALARLGVEVIAFPSKGDRLDLVRVLRELYETGIGSILVEGGADVASSFVEARLVDEFSMFIAPRFVGAGVLGFSNGSGLHIPGGKLEMKTICHELCGEDLLVRTFRERYSPEVVKRLSL